MAKKTDKHPFRDFAPGKKPNIPLTFCPICNEGIYKDQFGKYACGCHIDWTFDQLYRNYEMKIQESLVKELAKVNKTLGSRK